MEWVTFGIAVFGAVLSLVNSITDLVRYQPHVKVYFRRGFKMSRIEEDLTLVAGKMDE